MATKIRNKSVIGVRSGRNFLNSPQIHPFDDPENFSPIGPANLTVHFQSGNKTPNQKMASNRSKKMFEIFFQFLCSEFKTT